MDPVPAARRVGRGLRLRCPRCGRGAMFESWTRMRDECAVCGLRFEAARGEFTGAMMFAQGVLGAVAVMGWFFLFAFTSAPEWLALAWLVGFALSPLVLYRNLKGAWVGFLVVTLDR